jgi:Cu-Zn family superoxide dismutase
MPHAGPDAMQRHVGDLGNVTADSTGMIHKEFVDSQLTFEGANSILGKGLILHANPDDLNSQPTGNAGGRISCGVIEAAKE